MYVIQPQKASFVSTYSTLLSRTLWMLYLVTGWSKAAIFKSGAFTSEDNSLQSFIQLVETELLKEGLEPGQYQICAVNR